MEFFSNIKETTLIGLCKERNPAALNAVYKKYAKTVYSSIFRIIQHSAEAEDLVQETFITAFQGLDKLKEYNGFGAWLKKIAINKALDSLRKRKILTTSWEDEKIMELQDETSLDEEAFEFKVSEIKQAIASLPAGYRTIVQLYLFEELSQEEIGNLLGISHVTVRTQYHRARQRILQTIKNGGIR